MTQTINSMPGGIKRLLTDLINLAQFLQGYAEVEATVIARIEANGLLREAQENLNKIKLEADTDLETLKARNAAEANRIEAETAELRARYDDLNMRYEGLSEIKDQVASDIAHGHAKLETIKAELARIAGSLS